MTRIELTRELKTRGNKVLTTMIDTGCTREVYQLTEHVYVSIGTIPETDLYIYKPAKDGCIELIQIVDFKNIEMLFIVNNSKLGIMWYDAKGITL